MLQISAVAVEAIRAIWQAHQGLASGSDDDRRALTRKMAEQLATLDPRWGTKSADPGRPPSKDAVAYPVGDRLFAWDTINGSTRQVSVTAGQEGEDITGQTFIPVTPTNHLGTAPVPQTPPVVTFDLGPLVDKVEDIDARVTSIAQRVDEMHVGLMQQAERIYADLKASIAAAAPAPVPAPPSPSGVNSSEIVSALGELIGGLIRKQRAAKR